MHKDRTVQFNFAPAWQGIVSVFAVDFLRPGSIEAPYCRPQFKRDTSKFQQEVSREETETGSRTGRTSGLISSCW